MQFLFVIEEFISRQSRQGVQTVVLSIRFIKRFMLRELFYFLKISVFGQGIGSLLFRFS
jgi:hypothetical protein